MSHQVFLVSEKGEKAVVIPQIIGIEVESRGMGTWQVVITNADRGVVFFTGSKEAAMAKQLEYMQIVNGWYDECFA